MKIRLLKPITKYPRGTILEVEPKNEPPCDHFIHMDGKNKVWITCDMCEPADADIEELRSAIEKADALLKFSGHACSQDDCTQCDLIRAAQKFIPKD